MNYAIVARSVNEYQKASGRSSAVGLYLEARAWDLLNPGTLDGHKGRFLFGQNSDLMQEVQSPGFEVLLPFFVGDFAGNFNARALPQVLLSNFSITDLRGVLPPQLIDFVLELRALYEQRIFGTGIISQKEEFGVKQLLTAGYPVLLQQSPSKSETHNKVAQVMQEARQAYDSRNVVAGARALAASRANLAFWRSINAIVKTVAEGPQNILLGSGKLLANNPLIVLTGIAIAGLNLWLALRGKK